MSNLEVEVKGDSLEQPCGGGATTHTSRLVLTGQLL